MKRSLLGALLFLILVGEPTVGRTSGLFSPIGIVSFSVLYLSYFLLFDSLVHQYRLNNMQMVLANFALYSVLITGLLHGELRDYALHPHNDLITTLIRMQCSFFPLYVYPLLQKFVPGTKPALKVSVSLWIFVGAMSVLSFSRHFGIVDLLDTFRLVPHIGAAFSIAAIVALLFVLRPSKLSTRTYQKNQTVLLWSWIFLAVSLVPVFSLFIVLIFTMIPVSIYWLFQRKFRQLTYVT